MSSKLTLGTICEVLMGQSPPGYTCGTQIQGLPLLNGPTEFGAHHPTPVQFTSDPKRISKKGDLLFCVRGSTTGRMNYGDQVYAIGRGLAALRDTAGLPISLVKAVIENALPKLLAAASGSTFPSVCRKQIEDIELPCADFNVLKKAGELSGHIEELVLSLQHQNAALESIAQALFCSWFVDFDPVYAKFFGKEPEAMSTELAKLFPSEFEDSALGKIPKGWIASSVGQSFEINPRRKLSKGIQAPFLDMANVQTKGHRPEKHLEMREFGSGTKFMNGDTLLARITPCLENGKTAFVDFLKNGEVAGGSTEFIVLRSKDGRPLYWSYLLARFEPFRKHSINAMTGTSGRQRVDVETLKRFSFVCPSDELVKVVTPLFDSIQRLISGNTDIMLALNELRDHLLPRLISGKLALKEVEAAVAAITSALETEPA